jgi:hypothetical protein
MSVREQDEYGALRETIRERGTARVALFVVGVLGWAALLTATAALANSPLATVLPLIALAALFEALLSLHVGVERIGRYLQVHYEPEGQGWEHATMAFGKPPGAIAIDPLFSGIFLLATVVNFGPVVILNPIRAEMIFVGGAHLLFVIRVIVARAATARQRAIDLERFQQLHRPRG